MLNTCDFLGIYFTSIVDTGKLRAMIMPVKNLLTISEAAEAFHVSRQRMHALIKTYAVATVEPSPKLFLVSKEELKKIPEKRLPGPRSKKSA